MAEFENAIYYIICNVQLSQEILHPHKKSGQYYYATTNKVHTDQWLPRKDRENQLKEL